MQSKPWKPYRRFRPSLTAPEAKPTSSNRDSTKPSRDLDAHNATIKAQQEVLETKEAALRDATFRESELRVKLEILTGLLKTVVGEANNAIEMVEPKPEPVPVLVEETSTAGGTTPSDPTPSFDLGSIDASPSNVEGSVSSDPTQYGAGDFNALTTGTTTTSADIEDSSLLPGKFPWNDLVHPMDVAEPKPTEAAREPEVNPTVSVPTPSVSASPLESAQYDPCLPSLLAETL